MSPYRISIVLEDGYARLVLVAPCRCVSESVLLRESLGEVETEAVDIVLLHEIYEISLEIVTDERRFVVDVMEHIVIVLCSDIEPRVVRCCGTAVLVELRKWTASAGMVINHIEKDSHSPLVALIDEFLVILSCTVGLIESEE